MTNILDYRTCRACGGRGWYRTGPGGTKPCEFCCVHKFDESGLCRNGCGTRRDPQSGRTQRANIRPVPGEADHLSAPMNRDDIIAICIGGIIGFFVGICVVIVALFGSALI